MCADQLQIKANELQAGHQCEEESQVIITADQCIPSRKINQQQVSKCYLQEAYQFVLQQNDNCPEIQ